MRSPPGRLIEMEAVLCEAVEPECFVNADVAVASAVGRVGGGADAWRDGAGLDLERGAPCGGEVRPGASLCNR